MKNRICQFFIHTPPPGKTTGEKTFLRKNGYGNYENEEFQREKLKLWRVDMNPKMDVGEK
jgi:hypothetical protein